MAAKLRNTRYALSALASNATSAKKRNPIFDFPNGGNYRIKGKVSRLGVVGPYRVRLFDRRAALLIAETWSGLDGSYVFNYIGNKASGYFTVAHDNLGNPLNAAIADLVTPELMP